MATKYWQFNLDGIWEGAGNWCTSVGGTTSAPSFGDSAYFSYNADSYTRVITFTTNPLVVSEVRALSTHTGLVALDSLTETLVATNIVAEAGSGGFYFSCPVDVNTSLTNNSANDITFSNESYSSFHPTFNLTGAGSVVFGTFLATSSPYNYIDVNASDSGIMSFGILNTGTLNVHSGITRIGTGTSAAVSVSGDATLRLESGTQSGLISGGGSLEKTTLDTLVLPNANTFSGGTTLLQGVVKTNNTAALGTGPVTLTPSTTLQTSTAQPKLALGGKLTISGGTLHIGG